MSATNDAELPIGKLVDGVEMVTHEQLRAAVDKERERCVDIVQGARFGELDTDFRAIISMIEGGRTAEELKAQ